MSPREQSGGGARRQEQRGPEQDEGTLTSAKKRARSRSFSRWGYRRLADVATRGASCQPAFARGWCGAKCVQSWAGVKKPELDLNLDHLLVAQSWAVKSLPSNSFIFLLKFTVTRPSWGKPLATHEALNGLKWTDFPGGSSG